MNHQEKTRKVLNRIVNISMAICLISVTVCIAAAGAFFVQAKLSILNLIVGSGALAVVSLLLWDALEQVQTEYEEALNYIDICEAKVRVNNKQC